MLVTFKVRPQAEGVRVDDEHKECAFTPQSWGPKMGQIRLHYIMLLIISGA